MEDRKPERAAWSSMKSRCTNPNVGGYPRYGGRGIRVCDRWMRSFENFFSDMGPRPSVDHSLDRWPDNDGNYEPENCRWATRKEQMRNRSAYNRRVEWRGEVKTVSEWAEKSGIASHVAFSRIAAGWSAERAFTEAVAVGRKGKMAGIETLRVEWMGASKTISAWAEALGLCAMTLAYRIKQGWATERVFTQPIRAHRRSA